jgi:tetratricopeptide (TPR) repeat protein
MKAFLLIAVFLVPGVSLAQAGRTDQVIQRAVTAMGGLERIHAIHSLVFRGFHYEGSYKQEFAGSKKGDATLIRMRPGARLVGCRPEVPTCDGQWSGIVEGFDGQHGWELNWPKQRLVRTVNKAERALRCGAQFDFLFIDYKQRGFQAAYLGRKTVLGKQTEAIQIDQEGCSSAVYYFNSRNFQLMMTQLTIPIHARGDAVETVAVYKEFKVVNGVRLPSRSEEVNLKTGEVIGGGEWTSIAANTLHDPNIFEKIFEPPSVHPTGITAVVLEMLKSSADATPEQMISAYAKFRATGEGQQADVNYDMNWLGYELLKVDKYDHALAVFHQIIVESPSSAEAYENLGEAYLQQHDKGNAISAFQRAIDLGLKSDDVRRKLATLRRQE